MFFFKQKTAYEMRISDWSSDVCSSDLHARLQAAPQLLLMLPGTERRAHHMGGSVVPVGMPVDLVVHQQMAGQHLAEHALTLVARTGDQHGRASCRERVCQFV